MKLKKTVEEIGEAFEGFEDAAFETLVIECKGTSPLHLLGHIWLSEKQLYFGNAAENALQV